MFAISFVIIAFALMFSIQSKYFNERETLLITLSRNRIRGPDTNSITLYSIDEFIHEWTF